MLTRRAITIAFAVSIAFRGSAATFAADPPRNVLRPDLPFVLTPGVHAVDRVIVKFVDARPVRLVDGAWIGDAGADLETCRRLLAGARIEREFTRTVEDLDAERAHIRTRVPPGYPQPADLNQYYRVITTGVDDSERLVNALNAIPLVETAYAETAPEAIRPMGVDIPPTTPLFEPLQTYLGPPPLGLGYDAVRSVVGVTAPDIRIGHLEGSWHFGHEDAEQLVPANVVGSLPDWDWVEYESHGDAVAGILIADRNAFGIRGMSHAGKLILGSLESGSANMISLATAASQAGDVWASSYGHFTPGFQLAPVDWPQADFDAVYAATLKGIVYCFAAGNNSSDLANTSLFGTRYLPGAPDSGGVIVGAGESDTLDKMDESSFGQRVDCHAQGENIVTLAYGELFVGGSDPSQYWFQAYTDVFGITSGATPQVAGIAAALTNAVRAQNGVLLTAFEVRELLRHHGTPQGAGGHIGPRANLEMLLALHGLPDGLLVQGDGEVGQAVTVQLAGAPNAAVLLFVSGDRGKVAVGLNRAFLLDPNQMVVVDGLSLGPSGQLPVTARVPANPILKGADFFLQAATLTPTGAHLSNSAELWIRD